MAKCSKPVIPKALTFLFVWGICLAGCAPKKIPEITPADIAKLYAETGGAQTLQRLASGTPPDLAIVTRHVAEAAPEWLRIAGILLPYSDAAHAEDLHAALGGALAKDPAAVFRNVKSLSCPGLHFESACQMLPVCEEGDCKADAIELLQKRESALLALSSSATSEGSVDAERNEFAKKCLQLVRKQLKFFRIKSQARK